jgi:hypothetical protein
MKKPKHDSKALPTPIKECTLAVGDQASGMGNFVSQAIHSSDRRYLLEGHASIDRFAKNRCKILRSVIL